MLAFVGMALLFTGCATPVVDNTPGRPSSYVDHTTPAGKQGVGIGSQDIVSMTDRMMRDMLANPRLANASPPPKVILDAAFFKNEGHQPINKNLIVDRLRIELLRASQGRMVFLARHAADMTEHEQSLRQEGVVTGQTARPTSANYRLAGSIKALSTVDPSSGQRTRYHQITFEMIDLTSQEIVWGGMYEYQKAATEDLIYR
ncbi:MAG: penicillin-binding protein activator LpoB [Phycisphaerae bacterium]|nr:penicillin-binding protein activator LpoB [Phycisphaerae bacterium]